MGWSDIGSSIERVDPPAPSAAATSSRQLRLGRVRAWAAVFRPESVRALAGFELVVLGATALAGPDRLTRDDIAGLQAEGVLVLAHLSRRSADAPSLIGWSQRLLDSARSAFDDGFDGVYLDDLALDPPHPAARPAVNRVLSGVRRHFPGGLLLAQDVGPWLDRTHLDAVGPSRPLTADAPDDSLEPRSATPQPGLDGDRPAEGAAP